MTVLPFAMPNPFSFTKRVFAHYVPSFPLSINNQPAATDYYQEQFLAVDGEGGTHAAYGGYLRARPLPVPVQATFSAQVNMQQEVRLAIARGITGFCFDIQSFTDGLDPSGHLANLLTAAWSVHQLFEVVPMLDMSALVGLTQAQAVQLIATYANGSRWPAVARMVDGRMVVAAYNAVQPLAFWQGIISALNAQNINVAFIPVLLGSPTTSPLASLSLGVGGWGTATPAVEALPASYLCPVLPQQFRPKDLKFWEAANFEAFRAGWASAISGGGPLVQLVTWNDFSEGGVVQPCTDASLATNIGTGFYDLTAYYAAWFMMGRQPAVTRDVLYWCHKKMPSTAARASQLLAFTAVGPPEEDNIQLLAFLAAPGTLLINGQAMAAPAGVTSFKVPSVPGHPAFVLQRNGSNVFSGTGPVPIYGAAGSPAGTLDLTYWSGSLSSEGLA